MRRGSFRRLWWLGLFILGGVAIWVWYPRLHGYKAHKVPQETPARTPARDSEAFVARKSLDSLLESTALALANSGSETTPGLLAELRPALANAPALERTAAIRHFLDGRKDALTRLGFMLNSKGCLDEAPTFRVWLLDTWGQIDPAAAAQYARVILASKDSADEWAISLRNLAQGETGAEVKALLRSKWVEMLGYEEWRRQPSIGYLEAFDVAVYLGGTDLLSDLGSCLRERDNSAIAHAAYLALDRLVLQEPELVLKEFLSEPALAAGREVTRADYFARADVGRPRQRELLEMYLLEPWRLPAELDAFSGIFPNANFMLSHNLLSRQPTMSHEELVRRDEAALRVTREWLSDKRFEKLKPHLLRIEERLEASGKNIDAPKGRLNR